MIYVGLIRFNNAHDRVKELSSAIEWYTQASPTVLKKNSLTLCCGKLSSMNDMDEIWEHEAFILIGRIFAKTHEHSFGKENFKNICHLSKEQILEKIWGKYIYIHENTKASQFEIVIDPTGQLPFFYYVFADGNILFSSNIDIIFKVLSQKPEYNWTYLCSYLVYGNSSAIQTPFRNINELPPACYLAITKNERRTKPFWDPLRSYKTLAFHERDAVDILQSTLKPWIEPYKNICVSLSGGLDSSSLVFCLKDIIKEDQTLTALNYFHASVKSSDERSYARKVCSESGIELIEIDAFHSLPFDLSFRKQLLKPNKPYPGLISLSCLESISNSIPSNSSCSFISGHGSDHIFMRPPSKKSLADYILEKGLKGSKEQLKNIMGFFREPVFSILKKNIISLGAYFFCQHLEKRNPKNTVDDIPDWVQQKMHPMISTDFAHPIYEHLLAQILPGKYEQINAFYEGLASIHMDMSQINQTFYPFLYEPVVEFALSFPTYELFDKGYDRYPLRKSVSDHFTTESVWRRDKSQTTGILQLGLKENLEDVLALCLEGQFVQQGFIDKKGLRQTIMLLSNGDIKDLWPFMYIASVEIFLKHWEEKSL
jgi:asparagine synthase (glutamine-hydrolysing)